MTRRLQRTSALAAAVIAGAAVWAVRADDKPKAEKASPLDKIKALAGEWTQAGAKGETVSYRVVSGGSAVMENLFPGSDPVGQSVRVNGTAFRVVGVTDSKGSNGVQDQSVPEYITGVTGLVKLAKAFKLPTVITTSKADGPNGPVMPEIAKLAPHAVYSPRHGEVNAWDNDQFVKIVRDTGAIATISEHVRRLVSECLLGTAVKQHDLLSTVFRHDRILGDLDDPRKVGIRVAQLREEFVGFARAGRIAHGPLPQRVHSPSPGYEQAVLARIRIARRFRREPFRAFWRCDRIRPRRGARARLRPGMEHVATRTRRRCP